LLRNVADGMAAQKWGADSPNPIPDKAPRLSSEG
jgi:hypothetical protein